MSSTNDDVLDGVAIIGMYGRFPGARDLAEFWDNLVRGVESITHFSESELEPSRLESRGVRSLPNYVRARGLLDDIDRFDAAFFGVTPKEAAVMDPQHRVFLEAAWSALESAGYDPGAYEGPIGLWAGMANSTYYLENVLPRTDVVDQIGFFQAMLANEKDFLTTRVSYKLNLRGPSVNVYNACSTSLVAACHAYHALMGYQCDMALAGGVTITIPQRRGYLYTEGAIGSPDGRCRPFDAQGAGTVGGNGVGVVVLKRLEDAKADGDFVYAVIRGAAMNNDGSSKVSFTAPSVDGQAEVIAMAQAVAGVEPRSISCVEAHGTATPLGDPIEIAALTRAFRAGTSERQFCALGSVKSNIGHTDAAAGVAGLIKTALALQHRRMPPSLHYESPNPQIDFESSPFYVNAESCPWPEGPTPRRAGVSSFGIGGTNAHVVLEEAPSVEHVTPARREQLLVLSARTPSALDAATAQLASFLRAHPEWELADIAHTLQVGRRAFPVRRAVAATTTAEAADALEKKEPARVSTSLRANSDAKVAFLFPGQGSQYAGMAAQLYERERVFADEFDACAEALQPDLGLDIRSLVFAASSEREQAEQRLAETALTQPALFSVELALARLWMSWGIEPVAMIGHSLGEYVAACVAGVLSREEAATIVAERGKLMQAQPRGSMLAVRLGLGELEPWLGADLVVAGRNAPALNVVSGREEAIHDLERRLAERGIGCRQLATSHAFHSPMMDGALAPFREALSRLHFQKPTLRWISCVTGDWITPEQATDAEYWLRQLRAPVRFSDGVRLLCSDPAFALLEVGPGHQLGTLVRQHSDRPPEQVLVTSLGREPGEDVRMMLQALGQVWGAGVTPNWKAFHADEPRRRVPLPTYPFERQRFWVDAAPLDAVGAGHSPAYAAAELAERPEAPREGGATAATDATADASPQSVLGRLTTLLYETSGIRPEAIDPARSFLELGLDSLLLTQVSASIEKTFGVAVTFRQMLEQHPTAESLTRHIEASLGERAAPYRPGDDVTAAEPPTEELSTHAASAPVSEAQREVWAVVQMGPEASCAYNQCFVLTLRGRVSIDAFHRAVGRVFDRHEALRTRFDALGEKQIVQPPGSVNVPVRDLSSVPTHERESRLEAILAEEARTPFDLVNGGSARAQIVVESPDVVRLVLTAHHIVLDGWSTWLFFQDLASFYATETGTAGPSLAPAIPFRRHVEREASPEGRARAEKSLGYWRDLFADGTPSLELPIDRPRPLMKTYDAARETRRLTRVSSPDVARAASALGVTSVGLLLAAFQALLYRLTGQSDLVVGLPLSARRTDDRAGLIGHATNLLPMRAKIDGRSSFADLVGATRRALLDAQDHQWFTFGTLVHVLKVPRDPSRTPLVATLFNVDRGRNLPSYADCEAELTVPARRYANFEIELQLVDTLQELAPELTYNSDLLTPETAQRWLGHYEELLARVVVEPRTPLDQLPLLTDADRDALTGWNRTEAEYPRDLPMVGLVEQQVDRTPQRVAIRFGQERVSYKELDVRANQLSHVLRRRGAGRGTLVGLCLERSVDMVVAVLAVLKTGAAYVPLDPGFPSDRLAFMVEDSGLVLVVSESKLGGYHGCAAERTLELDRARDELARQSTERLGADERSAQPEDAAYVLYTSGSTGKPKGVRVPNRAAVNFLVSMQKEPGLGPDDRLLAVTTLSFDISLLELMLPLSVGAEIIMATRDEAMDGVALRGLLEQYDVTVMQATPATWRLLIESGWEKRRGFKALCGGEALALDLAESLLKRVEELWNMYGPTETTVWSSCWRVTEPRRGIPIGRPIANTTFWVLDPQVQMCPIGVPGEIYIGGDGVALGYLNRPELTAERFITDPFSATSGALMYRTGDLGRWRADGQLECLGRTDFQVKVRGFRIELGEIESVLSAHPSVKQAVVVAREDHPGDVRLVAYVIAAQGAAVDEQALRAHLKGALPQYMVPQHLVTLGAFPTTPNGKIDRKALPSPTVHETPASPPDAEPLTEAEALVAQVWKDVLGIASVDRHDNFFDLGGHSLLAMQVVSAIEKQSGKRVSPRDVLLQNLGQIAASLEAPGAEPASPAAAWTGKLSKMLKAFRKNR